MAFKGAITSVIAYASHQLWLKSVLENLPRMAAAPCLLDADGCCQGEGVGLLFFALFSSSTSLPHSRTSSNAYWISYCTTGHTL